MGFLTVAPRGRCAAGVQDRPKSLVLLSIVWNVANLHSPPSVVINRRQAYDRLLEVWTWDVGKSEGRLCNGGDTGCNITRPERELTSDWCSVVR